MGELWMPGLLAAYSAHNRNLAIIRSTRIASALARYRHEHGREASGLEELSLPKEATIDPFTGEPLKLKHTSDGWLIYTVMQNGIDDGGEFNGAQKKDYGFHAQTATSSEVAQTPKFPPRLAIQDRMKLHEPTATSRHLRTACTGLVSSGAPGVCGGAIGL